MWQNRQHIDHTCLKTFPDVDEPRRETPRKGTILRQLTVKQQTFDYIQGCKPDIKAILDNEHALQQLAEHENHLDSQQIRGQAIA